jgi:hypothetical protein
VKVSVLVAAERAPLVAVKDASNFTFRRSWWLHREAVADLARRTLSVTRVALLVLCPADRRPLPVTVSLPAAGIAITSVATRPLTLWLRILTFASFLTADRDVTAGCPPEGALAAERSTTSVVPPAPPGLVLAPLVDPAGLM